LIAPIANVLTLPFIPLTMLFGFLSGILSFVWDKLALPLAWITWILLTYIIKVISFLANIPFASLAVNFSIWGLVIYYLVLSLILFHHYKWKPRLKTS
jgi:competence protein ComEC